MGFWLLLVLNLYSEITFCPPESMHAFYLGTIKIEYTKGANETNIYLKLFADDFANALRNSFEDFKGFEFFTNQPDHINLARQYLVKHFRMTINQEESPIELELLQIEQSEDVLLFELRAEPGNAWEACQVYADLLMEIYPTQINVVQMNHLDQKRFFRLTQDTPNQLIKLF